MKDLFVINIFWMQLKEAAKIIQIFYFSMKASSASYGKFA